MLAVDFIHSGFDVDKMFFRKWEHSRLHLPSHDDFWSGQAIKYMCVVISAELAEIGKYIKISMNFFFSSKKLFIVVEWFNSERLVYKNASVIKN